MKKLIAILSVCALMLSCMLPVSAAEGKVTYQNDAGRIVFEPGSDHSLTDLFPDFKDVMPGDTLTQKITVKNDASDKVKVKLYIRSLGAHADSREFLSQLKLQVKKSGDNEMGYMFDAAADQPAQLTDWVYLGTLYSGGVVNLDVILHVPVELDNRFQSKIGYLDWEFMIEEFPVEPDDPQPPQTGDDSPVGLWIALVCVCAGAIIFLVWYQKRKEKPQDAA